jgi:predicted transcriptional regulator
MYLLPQEVEVWYIIPAIRKELSQFLVKKHGLTLEKAGHLLGISKAAVSQYLSNKRATKVKLSDIIKKEVEKSSDIIIKDSKKAVKEVQRLIQFIRKNKLPCEVCKKYNSDILEFCEKRCNNHG